MNHSWVSSQLYKMTISLQSCAHKENFGNTVLINHYDSNVKILFQHKDFFPRHRNPIIERRQSRDCLIFIMICHHRSWSMHITWCSVGLTIIEAWRHAIFKIKVCVKIMLRNLQTHLPHMWTKFNPVTMTIACNEVRHQITSVYNLFLWRVCCYASMSYHELVCYFHGWKYMYWNRKVIRVTALIFTGDIEGKLQRLQWIPGLSPWWPFHFRLWSCHWIPSTLLSTMNHTDLITTWTGFDTGTFILGVTVSQWW